MRLSVLLLALAIPALAAEIHTIAGTGVKGFSGDGGPATAAQLNNPFGIARGPDGALFICDMDNHRIRKVTPDGRIRTVAGTGQRGWSGDGGPATAAKMNQPHSLGFDRGGDLYICDIANHRIRKVDMKTGVITTFAGTGEKKTAPDGSKFAGAPLFGPRALAFDAKGAMWLALREGNALYRLDLAAGTLHHIAGAGGKAGFAGNGGPAKAAVLGGPKGVSIDPKGRVYLADTESHSIRFYDPAKQIIELLAGTGQKGDGPEGDPAQCKLARPHGVFVDTDGSVLVGDSEAHRVRRVR